MSVLGLIAKCTSNFCNTRRIVFPLGADSNKTTDIFLTVYKENVMERKLHQFTVFLKIYLSENSKQHALCRDLINLH